MTSRFAYLVPMTEANTAPDDLAFWTARGETFRAFLEDAGGPFDAENFATRDEAIRALKSEAAANGWDWATVQFSIDE